MILNKYSDIKKLHNPKLIRNIEAFACSMYIQQLGAAIGNTIKAVKYYTTDIRYQQEMQYQLDNDIAIVSVWADKRGDAVIDVIFDQDRIQALG